MQLESSFIVVLLPGAADVWTFVEEFGNNGYKVRTEPTEGVPAPR